MLKIVGRASRWLDVRRLAWTPRNVQNVGKTKTCMLMLLGYLAQILRLAGCKSGRRGVGCTGELARPPVLERRESSATPSPRLRCVCDVGCSIG